MTTYLDKVSESHLYKTVLDDHFLLYEDGSAPVGERSTATFVKLCGDDCPRHRFESLRVADEFLGVYTNGTEATVV